MSEDTADTSPAQNQARYITIAGRRFRVPGSPIARMAVGGLFVVGGVLGFLPVLGFWMIPLGLLILSIDLPSVRRRRRRMDVWVGRRVNGMRDAANGRKTSAESETKSRPENGGS